GDRDAARFFFRRLVDLVESHKLHFRIVLRQHFRDRCRQRRLAVIHVPDRPDVHVRLGSVKFFLRHLAYPSVNSKKCTGWKACAVVTSLLPEPLRSPLPQRSWAPDRSARSAWSRWRDPGLRTASQSCTQTFRKAARMP